MLKNRFGLCLVFAAIAMLALAGCGGDDGPSNPGTTYDTFTEEAAVVQAQTAAPQAVALVGQINSISNGFSKKGILYSYNEDNERWEWLYADDEEGYVYDFFYTVQYLANSVPQREVQGADAIVHTLNGTMDFDISSEGYNIIYNYDYGYDTNISGIGTDTRTLVGSGQHTVAYSYTGEGNSQSANYSANWETLGDGIQSSNDGCAVGTIRYRFGSFYTDVVFNGSDMATYTTYNSSGGVVAGGGGTAYTYCNAPALNEN